MIRELKLLLRQQNELRKKPGKSKVSYLCFNDFSETWQETKKVILTDDQLDCDIRKIINGDDSQLTMSTYLLYSQHIRRMVEGVAGYEVVFPLGLKRKDPKVYIVPDDYEFTKFLISKNQTIMIDVNDGTMSHSHDQSKSVDTHWVTFYKSITQGNEIELILEKVEKSKDLLLVLNHMKYQDARDVSNAVAEHFFK